METHNDSLTTGGGGSDRKEEDRFADDWKTFERGAEELSARGRERERGCRRGAWNVSSGNRIIQSVAISSSSGVTEEESGRGRWIAAALCQAYENSSRYSADGVV